MMMIGLLVMATTAAATTGDDRGLYIGGATLVSIVTAILGYFKGRTKNMSVSPQPFQVQRPSDGIYVTEQNCELRRVCLRQEFSSETKRIYDLIGQTQGMVIDVLKETAKSASSESIAAALVRVAEAVKEKK